VKSLEEQIGRSLFVRNRSGATLTPAGEEFQRFAQTFVQLWQRAKHQVAVPPGRTSVVALGGELSLWNPLLLRWLLWMKRSRPQVAVRAHVGLSDQLVNQILDGILDVAIMYAPRYQSGLKVELIVEEKLVLVTTAGDESAAEADYIYVDWGPEFSAQHDVRFPQRSEPGLFVGLGPLGLTYLLEAGGSGYFRLGAVRPLIERGLLSLVRDAPEFTYPAYAVYSEEANPDLLRPALDGLRQVAAELEEPSA
jgi:DNA-binding transcriptional LysR family regulator